MSDAEFVYTESHGADAEMYRASKRRRINGIRETVRAILPDGIRRLIM